MLAPWPLAERAEGADGGNVGQEEIAKKAAQKSGVDDDGELDSMSQITASVDAE
jgi:hypothetical protein